MEYLLQRVPSRAGARIVLINFNVRFVLVFLQRNSTEVISEGEIVTPHQTTLYKVLDSYLLHHALDGERNGCEFLPLLTAKIFELSRYACHSIRDTLESSTSVTTNSAATIKHDPGETPPLQRLDVLLPKVCQTIVLVTQCLCTLSLGNERILQSTATRSKRHMIDATSQGTGLIERLIGTFGTSSHLFPFPNRTEAAPLGQRNNGMKRVIVTASPHRSPRPARPFSASRYPRQGVIQRRTSRAFRRT